MAIAKTAELTGNALDWAVAKCEGWKYNDRAKLKEFKMQQLSSAKHCYSTVWAKGGPVIEREKICICPIGSPVGNLWSATDNSSICTAFGSNPLIAAMRCYVTSKLGDSVEIPSELL